MDDKGVLTIQTLAMPGDTNANGDIFGGWLVSQMDLAAGVLSKSIAQGRVATVAIDSLQFIKPVHVGDIVSCFCRLDNIGRTSMHIVVEVWTENFNLNTKMQVSMGKFTFVAIDKDGNPREVPQK